MSGQKPRRQQRHTRHRTQRRHRCQQHQVDDQWLGDLHCDSTDLLAGCQRPVTDGTERNRWQILQLALQHRPDFLGVGAQFVQVRGDHRFEIGHQPRSTPGGHPLIDVFVLKHVGGTPKDPLQWIICHTPRGGPHDTNRKRLHRTRECRDTRRLSPTILGAMVVVAIKVGEVPIGDDVREGLLGIGQCVACDLVQSCVIRGFGEG